MSRALKAGDRVRDKRARLAHRRGTVLRVERDGLARVAEVRWDDGSVQSCLTADLRRLPSGAQADDMGREPMVDILDY